MAASVPIEFCSFVLIHALVCGFEDSGDIKIPFRINVRSIRKESSGISGSLEYWSL